MILYSTAYLYHPDSSFSPDIDQIDLFDLALGKTLQQQKKFTPPKLSRHKNFKH
jgi:hypothetical protein